MSTEPVSALPELVEQLLHDPLGASRAASAAGGRVVGLVGNDVPVELVLAADAMPVQLPAFADTATPLANKYLESGFAHASHSIVEQWLSGALDHFESVVFSRADDGAQRLYYYLCELQRRGVTRGPRPLLYDLAKIQRPTSIAHTIATTRRLAQELGTGLAKLGAAIGLRNRRRVLFAQLAQQRLTDAAPAGTDVERISRASDLGPAAAFDASLAGWLQDTRAAQTGRRIALMGSVPPDERLHLAVAEAGGCVVDEIGDHSLTRLGNEIAAAADPLPALALHYQSLAFGPRSFQDRAAEVVRRATACRASGVILWLLEQDEALVWDVPAIQRALGAASLPLLCLARRRWDAQDGSLDAIRQFTESAA